jgi:hypothetical protein
VDTTMEYSSAIKENMGCKILDEISFRPVNTSFRRVVEICKAVAVVCITEEEEEEEEEEGNK